MNAPQETQQDDGDNRRQHDNKAVRRRLIGALVVFIAAFLLWEFGNKPPPPPSTPTFADVPKAESELPADLQAAATEADALDAELESEDDVRQNESHQFQAGVFAQQENADALAAALTDAGLSVVVEEDDVGFKLRVVNIGSEAEEKAAKELVAALTSSAENAAPSPAADSTDSADNDAQTTADTPTRIDTVAVQVGAFGKQASADRIARELTQQGFEVVVQATQRGGLTLHRVRVVALENKAAAEAARRELIKLGYPDSQVIDLL